MSENKSNLFNEVKNNSEKVNVASDYAISHPKASSSVLLKENGDITLTTSEYTQIKIDNGGSAIIQNSLSDTTNTVNKVINSTDITINKHKLNNQIIDLTDFRNVNGNIIGDIMFNGTVLVKTWEPNLEKWVLIRRPISTAMFSNRLNIPNSPEQFELDLNVMEDIRKYYTDKDE